MQPTIYDRIRERFFQHVSVRGPDECWKWTAKTDRDGYGIFREGTKEFRAHRVAFMLQYLRFFGDMPPVVMHACDNPSCCNPFHLFEGTQLENLMDRDMKDRQAKGSDNGRAKLDEDQVYGIKLWIRSGMLSLAAIGRRFSISKSVIRDIKGGKTWKHVKGVPGIVTMSVVNPPRAT